MTPFLRLRIAAFFRVFALQPAKEKRGDPDLYSVPFFVFHIPQLGIVAGKRAVALSRQCRKGIAHRARGDHL